jgi:enoyl-CoA hydratase
VGEDLQETAAGKSFDDRLIETDELQEVQRVILALGKPLIAAVRRYALGGGCEFAMSCDIRVLNIGAGSPPSAALCGGPKPGAICE